MKEMTINSIEKMFIESVTADDLFLTIWEEKKHSLKTAIEETVTDEGYEEYLNGEADYVTLFEIIVNGANHFIQGYPAPPVIKQHIYTTIREYLHQIKTRFGIKYSEELIEGTFPPIIVTDTNIALLKALHSKKEKAKNKEELVNTLGISRRELDKALRKLDPNLSKKKSSKSSPARLGGQLLRVAITEKKDNRKNGGGIEKSYYTEDTLHPVILQMNMYQVVSLLRSLCHEYDEGAFYTPLMIALDIWSQLSCYGKERLKEKFATQGTELKAFIDKIESFENQEGFQVFLTEKEMFYDKEELPLTEKIDLAFKGGRECDIRYHSDGKTIEEHNIILEMDFERGPDDFFISSDGTTNTKEQNNNRTRIKRTDIKWIRLH